MSIKPVEIQIRFSDIDVMGHVNNATYLSYFEYTRMHYFEKLLGLKWEWKKHGILLVRNEIEYLNKITINESGDIIYYYKGDGVYRVGINGDYINEEVLIPGNFYGVEVDPASGNILTFDAKGFSSDGVVGRYSADGDSITHYSVGVAPNGALIK